MTQSRLRILSVVINKHAAPAVTQKKAWGLEVVLWGLFWYWASKKIEDAYMKNRLCTSHYTSSTVTWTQLQFQRDILPPSSCQQLIPTLSQIVIFGTLLHHSICITYKFADFLFIAHIPESVVLAQYHEISWEFSFLFSTRLRILIVPDNSGNSTGY